MPSKDPALDALKKYPQAARLLGDPAALKALLTAPEVNALMAVLNRQAGGELRSAAAAAAAAAMGKPEALTAILSRAAQDQEGAAALKELQKKAPN